MPSKHIPAKPKTVAQVIEELKAFPLDAIIGTFSPWDGNGPCDYHPPFFSLNEDGTIHVDPDDGDYEWEDAHTDSTDPLNHPSINIDSKFNLGSRYALENI